MTWRRYGGALVALAALAIFVYLFADTQHWSTRSRLFSQVIVGPAVALALVQAVREIRRSRAGTPPPGPPEAATTRAATLWLGAFFASSFVLGLFATVPVFTVAYLRFEARFSWLVAAAYSVITVAFVWLVFDSLLHIPLMKGVIGVPGLS